MGYIGRQDLDKFVNEELDKIKEIENSTTEKIKGFKKEISTQYEDLVKQKGAKNGIAGLDENGKVKKEQLPNLNTIRDKNNEEFRPIFEIDKFETLDLSKDFTEIKQEGSGSAYIDKCFNDDKYIYILTNNSGHPNYYSEITIRDINTLKFINKIYRKKTVFMKQDNDYFYCINYGDECSNKKIYRMDKNDFSISNAIFESDNDICDIIIEKKYIYILTCVNIYILKKDDFSIISKSSKINDDCFSFCVDDNFIYVISINNIYIIDKKTLTIKMNTNSIKNIKSYRPSQCIVDDNFIYYNDKHSIKKIDKKTLKILAKYECELPEYLQTDNEFLYCKICKDDNDTEVIKINKNDLTIISTKREKAICGLCIKDNYIYFSTFYTFMKILKNGKTDTQKYYNGKNYEYTSKGVFITNITYKIKEFRRVIE